MNMFSESDSDDYSGLNNLALFLSLFELFLVGWVLSGLWDWFVLPIWKTLPDISMPYFTGIVFFISVITLPFREISHRDGLWSLLQIVTKIIVILALGFMGYILHLFI